MGAKTIINVGAKMIRIICEWLASFLPSITILDTEGKPYLTRYFFFGKERRHFNMFLHHFHASDKDADNGTPLLHNHPWRFSLSLILSGGYLEERRQPDDTVMSQRFPTGSFNYLNDAHFHRVDLLEADGWSLFMTGWRRSADSSWGFWNRDTKTYIPFREQLAKLGKEVIIP
jgi:hypothetical protein